jgi:hypothetical protein
MKEKKIKRSKVLIILVTSLVAILVISMTVGRELYQGRTQSIWSFGLIHFSGYLFFLLMPVEMAFIYYLSYYEEVELIMVAMGTAVIAQVMDYLIGYSFSAKFMHDLVGTKRIQRAFITDHCPGSWHDKIPVPRPDDVQHFRLADQIYYSESVVCQYKLVLRNHLLFRRTGKAKRVLLI